MSPGTKAQGQPREVQTAFRFWRKGLFENTVHHSDSRLTGDSVCGAVCNTPTHISSLGDHNHPTELGGARSLENQLREVGSGPSSLCEPQSLFPASGQRLRGSAVDKTPGRGPRAPGLRLRPRGSDLRCTAQPLGTRTPPWVRT